jgi:hypothetical protein
MTPDPDPFERGQRAAREDIPAEANPYQDGSEQHALWAAATSKLPVQPRQISPRAVRTIGEVSRSSSGRF